MALGDSILAHLRSNTMACGEPICAEWFSCVECVYFVSRFSFSGHTENLLVLIEKRSQ